MEVKVTLGALRGISPSLGGGVGKRFPRGNDIEKRLKGACQGM